MNADGTILILVTKNYDAMRQFFIDLGLNVPAENPGWAQVTPMLNQGRSCMIFLPSFLISLEESTDVPPSGPLYMQMEGFDEALLPTLKSKYPIKKVKGFLYDGDFYRITPPDGGEVMALPKASS
jgi:hypothetical protein